MPRSVLHCSDLGHGQLSILHFQASATSYSVFYMTYLYQDPVVEPPPVCADMRSFNGQLSFSDNLYHLQARKANGYAGRLSYTAVANSKQSAGKNAKDTARCNKAKLYW